MERKKMVMSVKAQRSMEAAPLVSEHDRFLIRMIHWAHFHYSFGH